MLVPNFNYAERFSKLRPMGIRFWKQFGIYIVFRETTPWNFQHRLSSCAKSSDLSNQMSKTYSISLLPLLLLLSLFYYYYYHWCCCYCSYCSHYCCYYHYLLLSPPPLPTVNTTTNTTATTTTSSSSYHHDFNHHYYATAGTFEVYSIAIYIYL